MSRSSARLCAGALALAALTLPAAAQSLAGAHAPGAASARAPSPCDLARPGRATYAGSLSLAGQFGCNSFTAGPWSAAHTPAGDELWVSLFGGTIGFGNCRVLRFDASSHQLLGSLTTGEGPQEMAFTTHGDGTLQYAFVAASSSSAVDVFDAAGQLVTSVALPFSPQATFPTAFPSALAVRPDQKRVYVGTLDGSGNVFSIRVATLALVPGERLNLGRDHGVGRMLFAGSTLVIPVTEFDPGFQGSTAKVVFVDPTQPAGATEVVLGSSVGAGLFPSPQDAALWCEDRVLVAGFDLGARVFALSASARALVGTIPTGTAHADGKLQALDVSPDGLVAVADLFTDEVAFLDAGLLQWIETVSLSALPDFHGALAELHFSPAGDALYGVANGTDSVARFDVQ